MIPKIFKIKKDNSWRNAYGYMWEIVGKYSTALAYNLCDAFIYWLYLCGIKIKINNNSYHIIKTVKEPKIGQYYEFYPDCIIDYNNVYKAFVQQIIPYNESKYELIYDCMYDYKLNEHAPDVRSLYNIWKDMHKHDDFKNASNPEYFLKLSVNEYDRFYSYAAKNKNGEWITFNIHSAFQRGKLVI